MESNIPHATGLVYVAILLVVFVGAVYGWNKFSDWINSCQTKTDKGDGCL
jgi:hypothetical protein